MNLAFDFYFCVHSSQVITVLVIVTGSFLVGVVGGGRGGGGVSVVPL